MSRIMLSSHASVFCLFLIGIANNAANSQTVTKGHTGTYQTGDASLDLVLREPTGDEPIDKKIKALQKIIRGVPAGSPRLEELGWLFVSKARISFDEGYYRQAEECALLLDKAKKGSPAGLLLKGHVEQSMHRFAEAEATAKILVAKRGLAYDYGLLGDALMERGKLDDATVAYQAMMDRKPGYQAYARAAHMRWLFGDVKGAEEMMKLAVNACSPRDVEAMAWAYAKLASYQFQLQKTKDASESIRSALAYVKGYAPALQIRGRLLMSKGSSAAAIADLSASARAYPLPEVQWALADAYRQAGRNGSADSIETMLAASGARKDPRTLSLFLATHKRSLPQALSLASRELSARQDVFTHDALAWAAYASGDLKTATLHADSALARGTQDPRLFLHAGIIAKAAGKKELARARLSSARSIFHLLLPSERKLLSNALARQPSPDPAKKIAQSADHQMADLGPALR